ncbi:MAG: hypothetical protein OXH99_20150 [Bryobacterales bacterium]|nr:hypothetical protein [Bryobacterales bacterium]
MHRSHPRWPLLVLLVLAAAFENFWMWPDDGLVFGLPVNLAYHLGLCVAASLALAAIVRWGWPHDAAGD